jgi:Peptidase family M1 domain
VAPVLAPNTAERPTLWLCFAFSSDLTEATGQEQVSFTPDRKVCDLIFRLWPNKPETAAEGSKLVIDAAQVDGADVKPVVTAAGAPKGKTGTLATLKLPKCSPGDKEIKIGLSFTLTLSPDSTERVGANATDEMAWAGTAFPLLAWVPGKGWATDQAVNLIGEMATSPAFTIQELRVVAAAGMKVGGTGKETSSTDDPPGFSTHVFASDAVRDVAVSVGRMSITTFDVGGVQVHLAEPLGGSRAGTQAWTKAVGAALPGLTADLGPLPYNDLWLTVTPARMTGIEYPGAVLFGDARQESLDTLVTHELAHQWFYALVGNNQAASPWLDEALAQYMTATVLGEKAQYRTIRIPASVRNKVGGSMSFYAHLQNPDLYAAGVYDQGAKMLFDIEDAIGVTTMRSILKAYISTEANKISTPAAMEKAFAGEPKAVAILKKYGAIS